MDAGPSRLAPNSLGTDAAVRYQISMSSEPLLPLEEILQVTAILARARLRRAPGLRSLGVMVGERLLFRRSDVATVFGSGTGVAGPRLRPVFPRTAARRPKTGLTAPETDAPEPKQRPSPNSHPLVAATKRGFQGAIPDREGLLHAYGDRALSVTVGKGLIERALGFLGQFVRLAEAAQYHIAFLPRGSTVSVRNVAFQFRVREGLRRTDHVPTAEEIADQKRYGYSYAPKYDLHLSGELRLYVKDEYGVEKVFSDRRGRPLEDQVARILKWLADEAVRREEADAQRACEQRLRLEHLHRQAEERRLAEEEEKRKHVLLQEARDWEQSHQLRRFMAAVRSQAERSAGEIQPGSAVAEWLSWAARMADELDPLSDPRCGKF